MAFSSVTRALERSPLTSELLTKLDQQGSLPSTVSPVCLRGWSASALAHGQKRPLVVIAATLEEAGRWATQLETMNWETVHFYPTSEASPYDPFDQESEMTWGQLQVLADLMALRSADDGDDKAGKMAIIATERALQPHLPPASTLETYCLRLNTGQEINLKTLSQRLAQLGYEKVGHLRNRGPVGTAGRHHRCVSGGVGTAGAAGTVWRRAGTAAGV
jgi:transcription-repair coupling factor (superfamily II helicase)